MWRCSRGSSLGRLLGHVIHLNDNHASLSGFSFAFCQYFARIPGISFFSTIKSSCVDSRHIKQDIKSNVFFNLPLKVTSHGFIKHLECNWCQKKNLDFIYRGGLKFIKENKNRFRRYKYSGKHLEVGVALHIYIYTVDLQ